MGGVEGEGGCGAGDKLVENESVGGGREGSEAWRNGALASGICSCLSLRIYALLQFFSENKILWFLSKRLLRPFSPTCFSIFEVHIFQNV